MAIRAIFFDAAGTLIKTARPVGESYASLARKYGMGVVAEEITARFRACFSSAPPLAFPGARPEELPTLERHWWKDLVRRVFEPYGPFGDFDDYFSDLFRYFSRADSWALYPETVETLAALRERGMVLDVVSNFDSRLFGILEGLGIASYFDSVIISSHAGYAKPAPEIFHKALRLHQLRAQEAAHVGDSPEKDAAGASEAGLIAILVDRHGGITGDAFPSIRNLKEILGLLEPRD